MYTDSHAHFDSFEKDGDLADIVQRALDAGVQTMIAIGGNDEANRLAVALGDRYPNTLYATVGYDRDKAGEEIPVGAMTHLAAHPNVVGIGETGLDYHYTPDTAPAQKDLFASMLEVARSLDLPSVVHSRDADEDTVDLLGTHRAAWTGDREALGVLHCFTGSQQFAEQLMELGMLISFSGIVTFKNAEALREVAKKVPDDRLLIETDAPYLAPVPLRGKRNEPAYVVHVAEAIATIRGTTPEQIAELTRENAARLFRLRERTASS